MFGLVDCNNFYASCERLFQPKFRRKPIVVLSNNDGCVIARSNEAKALGIEMGAPLFKIRPLVQRHGIALFSSNFPLYGDISARVMQVIGGMTPHIEVYSIDEAFLEVPSADLGRFGRDVHIRVRKWVGIPVTVGIGETKTLAKIGSWIGKRRNTLYHVCEPKDLIQVPIGEVWGIGKASATKLKRWGIHTAACMAASPPDRIRRLLGVIGMRTCLELKGEISYPLEQSPPLKKNIGISRSFPQAVTDLDVLYGAAAHFAERAGEKLRAQGSSASGLMVYLNTDRFGPDPYFGQTHNALCVATNRSTPLVKAACEGLKQLFRQGLKYKKLGILATGLTSAEGANLFSTYNERSERMQTSIDAINRRYGRSSVQSALNLRGEWLGGKNSLSNRYTTAWDELLEVS